MLKDSYGKKIKIGTFIRAAFERDYNSCNWGYIADWELVEYKTSNGKKFLKFETITERSKGVSSLSYFVSGKYPENWGFVWVKIIKKPTKLVRNCTGIKEWCDPSVKEWEKLFDFDNFKDGLY